MKKKNLLKKTKNVVGKYYRQMAMFSFILWANTYSVFANSAGTTALTNATSEIGKYVPFVRNLIYAIAGVVAIVGAISVYIKMNNEDQDVKKSIMMIVGACVFLVAAATALPKFFGY